MPPTALWILGIPPSRWEGNVVEKAARGEMQMASEVTLSGPQSSQGTLVCRQQSLLLRLICVTSTECVEYCVMSCP